MYNFFDEIFHQTFGVLQMGILVSLYKIYRAFSIVYDAIIAFRMLYVVLSSLRNLVLSFTTK